MGTSTSCSGGKTGSPFDPEWLAPDTSENTGKTNSPNQESPFTPSQSNKQNESLDNSKSEEEFAPKRRYAEAKRNISGYLSGKSNTSIKSALNSMINKGMGGAVGHQQR